MEKSERKKSSSPVKIAAGGVSAIIIIFFVSLFTTAAVRFHQFSEIKEAAPLSQEELFSLNDLMLSRYPENFQKIKNLPYSIPAPKLDVYAESAILIDVSNGCLLYEKNADLVIPPASMTKLFALYVVDEEVAA